MRSCNGHVTDTVATIPGTLWCQLLVYARAMFERTSGSRLMSVDVTSIVEVLEDLEDYPRWATQFRSVEVLERSVDGRPRRARFVMDAGFLKDTFTLDYTFEVTTSAATIRWCLVEAGLLAGLDGEYHLQTRPEGTEVRYLLEVDPGLPILGALRRKAEAVVIATALDDLEQVLTERSGAADRR